MIFVVWFLEQCSFDFLYSTLHNVRFCTFHVLLVGFDGTFYPGDQLIVMFFNKSILVSGRIMCGGSCGEFVMTGLQVKVLGSC